MKNLLGLPKFFPKVLLIINKTESIFVILKEHVFFSILVLKKHIGYQFNLLSCISGVDLLGSSYRFAVTYEILSFTFNNRIRIKTYLNETDILVSIIPIFKNANWWEREIWDLYGIFFKGHTDLRRILTDYGFEGYPMRKDFPLQGYIELRYETTKKRIIMEFVELAQEIRVFNFETSW